MKTEVLNMTVDELDILCNLYIECKLTVLEEKELEYVLSRTSLTSSSIEEVRSLIGIQTLTHTPSKPIRKRKIFDWRYAAGIAASVAILFSIGFTVLRYDDSQSTVQADYIAYVNGQEIQGNAAKAHIESETRKTEEFLSRLAELEEEEQNKIEHFMNHQNNIQ